MIHGEMWKKTLEMSVEWHIRLFLMGSRCHGFQQKTL